MPILAKAPRPETLAEAWNLLGEQALMIARLEAACDGFQGTIAALQVQIEKLTAQRKQDSTNSSRPPSSDGPKKGSRPARAPRSGRAQGAQLGHPAHQRTRTPVEQVDAVVEHWPAVCRHCETPLEPDPAEVGAPVRHQVTEIPPVRPVVTEHRLHRARCARCGGETRAALPADVPAGAFGPGVQARVALLSGRYRLSRREVVAASGDLFDLNLSVGSVDKLCQASAQALAQPVEELAATLPAASEVHADETTWWRTGKRKWLWVVVTPFGTLFQIAASRGRVVIQDLLGKDFAGYLVSDRFSAYNWLAPQQRQVCWAHLKRDFQGLVDYGGAAAPVGKTALALTERLFAAWHSPAPDPATLAAIQTEFVALFAAEQTNPTQAGAVCRDLLKRGPALWTFLSIDGVEPTNNAAERALRPAVLWRKGSFGTQSEAGDRFVERLLTVTSTLRSQQRNLLDFLTDAANAALRGQPPPSLLLPSP